MSPPDHSSNSLKPFLQNETNLVPRPFNNIQISYLFLLRRPFVLVRRRFQVLIKVILLPACAVHFGLKNSCRCLGAHSLLLPTWADMTTPALGFLIISLTVGLNLALTPRSLACFICLSSMSSTSSMSPSPTASACPESLSGPS